jgi:glucans biosynthesis protein C
VLRKKNNPSGGESMTQHKRTLPRFNDVDTYRALLMLLALFLHAAAVYATNRPNVTSNTERLDFFSWLLNILHLMVTPSFFVISGFVLAHMIAHLSLQMVWAERLKRLVIPTLSVGLTFNIVENFLRYRDSGGTLAFPQFLTSPDFSELWLSGNWQLHLWFLVSLIVYSFFTLSAASLLPQNHFLYRLLRRVGDSVARMSATAAGFLALVLLLGGVNLMLSGLTSRLPFAYDVLVPGLQSPMKLAESLPYFLFGLLMYSSTALQNVVFRFRAHIIFLAFAGLALQPYPPSNSDFWHEAALQYAQNIVCWLSVFGGLQFFHRFFNEPSDWRRQWIGRAQSMYLFHHSLVYIGGTLLVSVSLPPLIEFILLVSVIVPLVILLHDHVIKRVPLIGLLFNGRAPTHAHQTTGQKLPQPAE